jgi:hypothetical protein
MSTIDLVFNQTNFPVPKRPLVDFLEKWKLFEATRYVVQSSVPLEIFKAFVASLTAKTKISITRGNAVYLWALANEFLLSEVAAECQTFSVPVDQFFSLSDQVNKFVQQSVAQMSSLTNQQDRFHHHTDEKIDSQARELENLRLTLNDLQTTWNDKFAELSRRLDELALGSKSSPCASPEPTAEQTGSRSVSTVHPTSAPSPSTSAGAKPQQFPTKVEIRPIRQKPFEGIISSLTKQYRGNVHNQKIVIITSMSVYSDDAKYAVSNVADLTVPSSFCSANKNKQWICWNFKGMRISVSHYTIKTVYLKSWIVEGSVDGINWWPISTQKDNSDFKSKWATMTFDVSEQIECCFIRLTQTDKRYCATDTDSLFLGAVEFFGTLEQLPQSSSDGIISSLTAKYGGNVHEKDIVKLTSSSVSHDPTCALKNVVDLTSRSKFVSGRTTGDWICWDFRQMRVCPTHYTIECKFLKTWVVEGSVDGDNWTEIDRHTNNQDFRTSSGPASFGVLKRMQYRFIRLTQTANCHSGGFGLTLCAVDFFGILSE